MNGNPKRYKDKLPEKSAFSIIHENNNTQHVHKKIPLNILTTYNQ